MASVFTATTAGYDGVPPVVQADPELRYVCFSDTPVEVPQPWELRLIPRLFDDPAVDARRIKFHPHLFLPDDDVSLWLDSNISPVDLRARDLRRWLDSADLVIPLNPVYDSWEAEAEFLADWQYDDPAAIAAQVQRLRALGTPPDLPQAASGFIVRRHWHPTVLRQSALWWDLLVNYHRRDQIPLAHSLWASGVRAEFVTLDGLFARHVQWTHGGLAQHRAPRPKSSDRAGQGFTVRDSGLHSLHAKPIWNEPLTRDLLVKFSALGGTAHELGEPLEPNICFIDGESRFHQMPPDPRRALTREVLRRAAADRRRCTALGFGAGYSAALMLETNPNLVATFVDRAATHHSRACADLMGRWYVDRFEIFWGRSRDVLPNLTDRLQESDLVLLDPAEETDSVAGDLRHVVDGCRAGTRVVVDRMDRSETAGPVMAQVSAGRLRSSVDLFGAQTAVFELVGS